MFYNYYETENIRISDKISNGGLMRVSPLIKIYNNTINIEELVRILHYLIHLNELSIKVSITYINILNY